MNLVFFRYLSSDFNLLLAKYNLYDFGSLLEEHFTGNVKCKNWRGTWAVV